VTAKPTGRLVGVIGVALAGPAFAQTVPAPPPTTQEDPAAFEDIVVTGQLGGPRPQPDAVEFLRRFCFEPLRRTHGPAPPSDQKRWEELEEKTRGEFRITDPSVPAYSFVDHGRDHFLLLKFEQFSHPARVVENRCTLVVIGGQDHARFQGAMSKLFGRGGVESHVGESYGTPVVPGWRQWAWTGMPGRRSKAWQALQSARGVQGGGGYLVVIDPDFYNEYDYIVGDLKVKEKAARPVSMLSFSHFRRS
jgi:hypothetical protein